MFKFLLFIFIGTSFLKTQITPKIEGIYRSTGCELSIELTGQKPNYNYHLKSKFRDAKGKALVSFDIKSKTYIIELAAAKMSEPSELRKSPNISFSLSRDTIILQNTGNAMNYYVQLNDCDEKYITLVKQTK